MTDRRTDPSLQDLHRGLLTGAAVLLAVAGVAGIAGFSMFGAAVIAASRRWYQRADLPPQHLANLKWQQARAAMEAGASAWRDTEKNAYSPQSSAPAR
jgi:hypothetical protein